MKSFIALAATAALALSANAAPMQSRANPGKKGSNFNFASAVNPLGPAVSWAYNWAPEKDGPLPAGVEYVPMLFSTDPNHATGWKEKAEAAIAAGATHILGFNEPDLATQANLSPEAAAGAWRDLIQPFAGRVKLVSPAITNGPPPAMGTGWMDAFLAACTGCTIDAIAMHAYDSATNVAYFQSYIPEVAKKYGKPVWVTEFAGSGTEQQQVDFINTMIPFLDKEPSVERYAYFATLEGNLVAGGGLTATGKAYSAAK